MASGSSLLRLVVSFATVDRLSQPLRGIVGLAQNGSERLAGMKREARDLERELKGVQTKLADAGENSAALRAKEAELTAQLGRTNKEMEQQVRLMKVANSTEKMRARGDALKSAGTSNVLGGAAIFTGLGVAAKGGMDFQSGMTDIALKADLSQRDTAKLASNILSAARAAKALPENLRAGVDTLAGFGMSPQEATRMIAPIGKVATAYKAEIDDLASASFANFSNLKVPVNETAKALEAMAAAGNAGAFEIKDMAQYFPALTAQAQAFGQHGVAAVADLAAAAQIARKGTGDSATAATNLQNLLAKINTEETIKKFAKMGVDLPAALKKAYAEGKTPLEAIAGITEKTLGGKLDKLSFLFGDMQAQSALRPLIQNMDEYRRIRSEAMASKGAIDEAFARRGQDAATQAQALVGNLQRMAIILGPVLLPPLVAISEKLLVLSDRVAAWAQANPQATRTIIGLVAGLGAFKVGLGIVQFAFGSLLGPIATVYKFFAGGSLMTAFTIARTAFMFLARGVMQAGLFMMANPIVAIIVGIAAAVGLAGYLIYKHWDTIKGAFNAGMAFLSGLAGKAMTYGQAMLDGLVNGITSRIAAVKSMVMGIAGKVADWFRGVLGIHSPSRVFMAFGGHIVGGLALGIDANAAHATSAIDRLGRDVARTGFSMPAMAPLGGGGSAGGGGGAGSAAGGGRRGDVIIHVYGAPGQSERALAAEVEKLFSQHVKHQDASSRSAFRDEE